MLYSSTGIPKQAYLLPFSARELQVQKWTNPKLLKLPPVPSKTGPSSSSLTLRKAVSLLGTKMKDCSLH
jgi:hypothetical protein